MKVWCWLVCVVVAAGVGAGAHRVLSAGSNAPAASASSTNAIWFAHMAALRQRVPTGFTVVVRTPFVVIGDETPEVVAVRAENTVKWAVDALKKDYFACDPMHIIDIWLFQDDVSYRTHARQLFNDMPTTPFGYYAEQHRALIMNIATGGGTLVHEIVHPFMRANFPACPAWFNEGFASLYEQSNRRDGHIVGLTNWRLAGLQEAIGKDAILTFKQLTATTDDEFYGGVGSRNYNQYYAQARYLCYYLQEHGMLTNYYHQFVANAKTDPTGYATLQRVLGEKDMDAFAEKWKAYVLKLRFP